MTHEPFVRPELNVDDVTGDLQQRTHRHSQRQLYP
ncbi:Uncharacterised protein [Serratia marcescens]|uniref:Uncharacterized protein n=1 Tax=Serratia marcescens TaxID=615 RepID=A0A379ZST5_SERMA|nr:Uncharacterised protein [Serratia marcescens]